MKYSSAPLLLFLLLVFSLPMRGQTSELKRIASSFDEEYQRGLLSFFADDRMEGRASNGKGALLTISLVNNLFAKWDLIPFYNSSYVQTFKMDTLTGRNIAGVILANGYSEEYIVVSAHYDHLGVMNGNIYNGADDNASGVTAVMTLANLFSRLKTSSVHLRKNIIFLLLDGKEHNLAGSEDFLKRLPVPVKKIVCNINIDQIGTTFAPPGTNEKYMLVLGERKNRHIITTKLDAANRFYETGFDLDYSFYKSPSFAELFFRSSDQYSFAKKGIPSVLVTSGIHMHTYKTTDDHYFINYPVLAERTRLLFYHIYHMTLSY